MKFNFNLYIILGISGDATTEEIKKVYRDLSKKYHPDVPETGDEELFKKISIAYSILSDPEKRNLYDLGKWDSLEPSNKIELSEAEQNILGLFETKFEHIYDLADEIDSVGETFVLNSFIETMKESLERELLGYEKTQYILEEDIKLLNRFKDKIEFKCRKTEHNLIKMALDQTISMKEDEIKEIKKEKDLAIIMLDVLTDFEGKKGGIKLMSGLKKIVAGKKINPMDKFLLDKD
jgi:curved DNA-binding protein CbpA